jgi:hypothetical protein
MGLTSKEIVFPEVARDGTLGLVLHDQQGNEIFPETKHITYESIWEDITTGWRECVAAYEEDPSDFYNAWNYLDLHPAFWKFRYGPADRQPAKKAPRKRRMALRKRAEVEKTMPVAERLHVRHLEYEYGIRRCVDIMVGKNSAEDGSGLKPQVWVETEVGQQSWPEEFDPKDPNSGDKQYHDYKLDADGPTVEKAIIRVAHNVWSAYGNDRRVCDAPYNELVYKTIVDDETFEEMMRDESQEAVAEVRELRAAQVKQAMKDFNGYDPTPEEEAQADAELNRRLGISEED